MNAIRCSGFKRTSPLCFVSQICTKLTFENVPEKLSLVKELVLGGAV